MHEIAQNSIERVEKANYRIEFFLSDQDIGCFLPLRQKNPQYRVIDTTYNTMVRMNAGPNP